MVNIDFSKILLHPKRVVEWLENGDCYPIYLEIGPTNACNHKCIFCALDWLKKGATYIDKDIMKDNLEEIAGLGIKSLMFAGEGEPLLHKDIGYFTHVAKKAGIDTSITTNGVLLSKRKIEEILPNLSWIRFSIDSGSPENYSLVHGTYSRDFGKLMENIKNAVDYKREHNLAVTIGTQFLVIPQNIGEATNLARRLKEIGVDNLQIKPYSHHPSSINKLDINFSEYNELEESLREFNSDFFKINFRRATAERIFQGPNYDKCYGLPFITVIDSKGDVIPCNLFYNQPEFTYGNLYKNSFQEIWEGEKRKQVIKKLNSLGTKHCRCGCRLDPTNRDLHRIKNPEPHDNFI